MKKKGQTISIIALFAAILILIFDSKTAILGAREGLTLCSYTVIPSLFPFLVLSILLTDVLSGSSLRLFKPIGKLCKMPEGSESLILIGLLGGYPVGAKSIFDSWKRGKISKNDALRCLGFCNNAGPAFIFGMCGSVFSNHLAVLHLWLIQITSALFVGAILPKAKSNEIHKTDSTKISLAAAMSKAISAMLNVCGWVTFFRIVIVFAQRWFLWLLPAGWNVVLTGICELANGCTYLAEMESEGLKLVLCTLFLSFGGLCVSLQTASVVGELGTGMYFPGKVIQCVISCFMAMIFAYIKYYQYQPIILFSIVLLFGVTILFVKKIVAFPGILVYNVENDCNGGFLCYSGRKSQSPAATVPMEPR